MTGRCTHGFLHLWFSSAQLRAPPLRVILDPQTKFTALAFRMRSWHSWELRANVLCFRSYLGKAAGLRWTHPGSSLRTFTSIRPYQVQIGLICLLLCLVTVFGKKDIPVLVMYCQERLTWSQGFFSLFWLGTPRRLGLPAASRCGSSQSIILTFVSVCNQVLEIWRILDLTVQWFQEL